MRYVVNGEPEELVKDSSVSVAWVEDRLIVRTLEGSESALAVRSGDSILVSYRGQLIVVEKETGKRSATKEGKSGDAKAPMPGQVVDIFVEQGEQVRTGQKLLVLEAMKMQHSVTAPFDGLVTALPVSKGQQVTEGQLLVHVEATHDENPQSPAN